jgi:hypothetical protein
MKSKSSSLTSKAPAPRLRVGLQDVSQAEFTEAVEKKLSKQRVWRKGTVTPGGGVTATIQALRRSRGKNKKPT